MEGYLNTFLQALQPFQIEKIGDGVTNASYARGFKITPQLWQTYPSIEKYYFDYEKTYDPEPLLDAMKASHYTLPLAAVTIYYIMICVVPKMKLMDKGFISKSTFDTYLGIWNLFLSLFSFYGAFRVVPHLFHLLSIQSFQQTMCTPAHINFGVGAVGLASQMFCISKLPELVDTLFIVIKGKNPEFLHWYHHITVLLYCWNSYVTESSAGVYFIAMNYSVHAIMYFYFFLMVTKVVPSFIMKAIAPFITFIQITQMLIGMFIVGSSIYFNYNGVACANQISTLVCGFFMYLSYFILFVLFALGKYDPSKQAKTGAKAKKVN